MGVMELVSRQKVQIRTRVGSFQKKLGLWNKEELAQPRDSGQAFLGKEVQIQETDTRETENTGVARVRPHRWCQTSTALNFILGNFFL